MKEIPANRLSDFSPVELEIRVFCTRCDHQAWLNRAALPDTLLGLVDRTHRCSLTETQRRRATQCPCFGAWAFCTRGNRCVARAILKSHRWSK